MSYFQFSSVSNADYTVSKEHYHDNLEIYMLLEGRCWYFIDNKSYLLSSGDIVIIPQGVIHKVNYETPTHSRILINCDASFVPEAVWEVLGEVPCFPKTDRTDDKIRKIFAVIEKENKKTDEFWRDIIKTKIAELLILIVRESRETAPIVTQSVIVEKAVEYIQKNHQGKLSLEDAAKYCFVSPAHLSRTFKKETGFGFCEYLNIYRLKKADMLLSDGKKHKISEISELCGFEDSNYFSKMYKQMYGISPKKRMQI